jgi:hypothetical protein
MRRYFGGATHEDEEQEKVEDEIEEEEALRIFAEQHRHRVTEQDPAEVGVI